MKKKIGQKRHFGSKHKAEYFFGAQHTFALCEHPKKYSNAEIGPKGKLIADL